MLVLTRKKKQSLMLGDDIEIQILEVQGEQVRLGISAPKSLRVWRKEIYTDIHSANAAAAAAEVSPQLLKKISSQASGKGGKVRIKT